MTSVRGQQVLCIVIDLMCLYTPRNVNPLSSRKSLNSGIIGPDDHSQLNLSLEEYFMVYLVINVL
jgi:hypothetical protein